MFLAATVQAAGLLGSQEAGFTFCELLGLEHAERTTYGSPEDLRLQAQLGSAPRL